MPTVFIPQQPARYDKAADIWLPTVDVTPAEKFGKLRIMFDMRSSRVPMQHLGSLVKNHIAGFQEDDFLVGLGDPSILAMCAAHIGIKFQGRKFKMLTWDRFSMNYISREIDLGPA